MKKFLIHLSRLTFLLTALMLMVARAVSAAPAQTVVTWTLNGSGNWSDAANWSTDPIYPNDGLPLVGDTYAVQIGQGQVDVDVAVSVTSLTLTGGTLRAGENTSLTVTGAFDWSGGNLDYNGSDPRIAIGAGAVSTWSGSMGWNNVEVTNAGSLTFADGVTLNLQTEYGAMNGLHTLVGGTVTLVNSGFWDGTWFGEGSEPVAFTNSGTVTKSGAGTFTFGSSSDYSPTMPFTNHGLVQVSAGVLAVEGSAQGAGAWTVADGATLQFGNGNLAAGSSVSGAGDVEFTGSSTLSGAITVTGETRVGSFVTFNSVDPIAISTLVVQPSGNLNGSAALTATDEFTWDGTVAGSNVSETFTLSAGAAGTASANAVFTLDRRTFQNEGTFTWTGGDAPADSVMRFFNSAVFNNTGTFIAAGNSTGGIVGFSGSTFGTFNNTGTFVKSGAGTTTVLNWTFANPGEVDVQSGTLSIRSPSDVSGLFTVADGGALILRSKFTGFTATTIHDGEFALTGTGSVTFDAGTLGTAATFTGAGGVVTLGAASSETLTVARDTIAADLVRFDGPVRLSPPSNVFTLADAEIASGTVGMLAGTTLRITDSLVWSGGTVALPPGFVGFAGGTLELAAGSTATVTGAATFGIGTGDFAGALTVASGGALIIGGGVTIENSGSIAAAAGGVLTLAPSTTAAVDARISGGTLSTSDTGRLRIAQSRAVVGGSSYATLDGVAFDGVIELTQNHSVVRLVNGSTAAGRVEYTAAGAAGYTAFEMHQSGTLDNLVFEDTTAAGDAEATFIVIGNRSVTLGPGVELRQLTAINGDYFVGGEGADAGDLIPTGSATLINQGRVVVDGAGRFTRFNATDTFENQGTLEARNGATITIDREFTQTAGVIELHAGSTFRLTNPSHIVSTRMLSLNGGALMGDGTFTGNLAVGDAVLAPAFGSALDAVGELTLDLAMAEGFTVVDASRWQFDLGGLVAGASYDSIVFSGAPEIELGGVLELSFTNGFAGVITGTDTFSLLTGSTFSGSFFNVAPGERLATTDGFGSFQVNYGSGSAFGADAVVLSGYVSAVPEPSTWAALLLGGAALAGAIRRRRTQPA